MTTASTPVVCRAIPTDILHFPARVVVSPADALNRPRGVERHVGTADDLSMPTTARPQQRYDHRLRNLVQRTGDVTIATDLGVPRSTARARSGKPPSVVVRLGVPEWTPA